MCVNETNYTNLFVQNKVVDKHLAIFVLNFMIFFHLITEE